MKLLVFGRTGQLATELVRRAPQGWALTRLGREAADLEDPEACARAVAESDAGLVINAAAYTAVDRAEEEEDRAHVINAEAPAAMARAAAARGVPFLHVSTDYVFDGAGERPWRPDDAPAPLGAYGRTKLAGERGVAAAGGAHLVLRTSWVFSAHGSNFVKTMLRVGPERGALRVVEDQIGGPTAAGDIAEALFAVAATFADGRGTSGVYHFAGQPFVSWADFALEIFARAGLDVAVAAIPSSEYPTPAPRPRNSRLDGAALMADYGVALPDWRAALDNVLTEIGP